MAVTIASYPLNNVGYVAENARLWTATRTNGVFSSESHFKVTPVANQQMTIQISPGIGWMRISEYEGIAIAIKEPVTLQLPTAHNLLKRIEGIVIRFNKISNVVEADYVSSAPSSSPVAPLPTQMGIDAHELMIAYVSSTPTTRYLTAANISDKRLDTSLCGIMRDGVTGIPTETLYAEWYAWYTELKSDAEEKARIFKEWIEIFQEEFGDDATAWFRERDEVFNRWLSALGDQIAENVGASIFGFAIEDVYLWLYYSEGIDPHSFTIEDGYLMYNIGDSVIGGTLTSEINDLKRRLDAIEKLDALNLIAEILE